MTTPRLGAPELVEAQAVPETTVNEQIRHLEQMASRCIAKDKDLATPPGSPADGDTYIIAGSPTGAWAGRPNQIAYYLSTAWAFIVPIEGSRAYLQDENLEYRFDGGATWAADNSILTPASDAQIWAGSSSAVVLTPANLFTSSEPQALTSGATITPDGDNGFNFTLLLGHNATLANPSDFKAGQSGLIVITQDTGEPWTLAYGSNWKFPGGAPVLSTAAGAVDLLTYYVVTSSFYVCTLTKAYSS